MVVSVVTVITSLILAYFFREKTRVSGGNDAQQNSSGSTPRPVDRETFRKNAWTIFKGLFWLAVIAMVFLWGRSCIESGALELRAREQARQAEAKKQWILEHDLPEGSMFARTAEVVGLSDTPEALEFRTRFPHQGDEAGSAHFLWIRKNRYGTWQHVGANVSGEFWFTKISDNHYEGWTKRNGGELGEVPTRLIRR